VRPLSIHLVEQRLCLLKISGIEALSKPSINRREQTLGLIASALSLQDSGEAHRRSQLQEPGTLLLCRFKGLVQAPFHLIAAPHFEKQFALDSIQLGRKPAVTALVGRFTDET